MSGILIAYYSRAGENWWDGGVRNIPKGNTERVAEFIGQAVGGDLFRIETIEDYPADYYECIEVAKKELQDGIRPEIRDIAGGMDRYDTVFLGFPNWWGTAPMCVFSFLEKHDLSGKRIVPFCTNEGSGMGRSESDLRQECKGATVERGLSVMGHEAAESQKTVAAWAKRFA